VVSHHGRGRQRGPAVHQLHVLVEQLLLVAAVVLLQYAHDTLMDANVLLFGLHHPHPFLSHRVHDPVHVYVIVHLRRVVERLQNPVQGYERTGTSDARAKYTRDSLLLLLVDTVGREMFCPAIFYGALNQILNVQVVSRAQSRTIIYHRHRLLTTSCRQLEKTFVPIRSRSSPLFVRQRN